MFPKSVLAEVNHGISRQKQIYSADELTYFGESQTINKYLTKKGNGSQYTAINYKSKLIAFAQFCCQKFPDQSMDAVIQEIKTGKHDPYDLLNEFTGFLQRRKGDLKLHPTSVVNTVKTVRRYLRHSGVTSVNAEDFKEFVTLPRRTKTERKSLDKTTIAKLLNSCRTLKLRAAISLFACTGARASEGMAVRVKDLNLDATVPTITFRAEFSKMRITRTRYLTQETAETLRLWLKKKYESRWTNVYVNGAKKNLWVEPKTSPDDLVFGGWTYEADKQSRDPYAVYDRIQELFRNLIASVGLDELEDHGHRRKITLNSFRHFVKSQISDLGYADFSEYFIGHAGSTYYDRPEKERLALYKKIEPYLTFVDVGALEAKGADYETRMSQLQAELANERAEREKLYRLLYSQGVIKDPSSP